MFAQAQISKPLAIAPVSALLLGLFMVALGNGLQGTLVAVRAGLEKFPEETIGVIMSAYFVGYMLGSVIVPNFVERVGHIRTFAAMASIASAATLSHLLIIEPISWSLFRAVNGFCIAGLALVIESWLNERSTNDNRGTVFSAYILIKASGVLSSCDTFDTKSVFNFVSCNSFFMVRIINQTPNSIRISTAIIRAKLYINRS